MTDSSKTLLGTVCALVALVACTAIMARCSVQVDAMQTEASECVKAGGLWHPSADPINGGRCEERSK